MGFCEFSTHGVKAVIVNFICSKCGEDVESDEINLFSPNIETEKASNSHSNNIDRTECPKCGENYDVGVFARWPDGYIDIDDVDAESIALKIVEDEEYYDYVVSSQIDSIIESSNFIIQFNQEIENLKSLNNVNLHDITLQETLQKQIYSGIITCLEDYLSTTLIQNVLNNDEYFKNFVKTYPNMKKRRFNLNEIYEKIDDLRDIVKMELIEVIYHDLPKIKLMYQETFKVDFPIINDLMQIIMNRHDLVHRNGKNKDGKKIEISSTDVLEAIDKVDQFVKDIDSKIFIKENTIKAF